MSALHFFPFGLKTEEVYKETVSELWFPEPLFIFSFSVPLFISWDLAERLQQQKTADGKFHGGDNTIPEKYVVSNMGALHKSLIILFCYFCVWREGC